MLWSFRNSFIGKPTSTVRTDTKREGAGMGLFGVLKEERLQIRTGYPCPQIATMFSGGLIHEDWFLPPLRQPMQTVTGELGPWPPSDNSIFRSPTVSFVNYPLNDGKLSSRAVCFNVVWNRRIDRRTETQNFTHICCKCLCTGLYLGMDRGQKRLFSVKLWPTYFQWFPSQTPVMVSPSDTSPRDPWSPVYNQANNSFLISEATCSILLTTGPKSSCLLFIASLKCHHKLWSAPRMVARILITPTWAMAKFSKRFIYIEMCTDGHLKTIFSAILIKHLIW